MSTIAKLSNGTLLKMGDGASPEVFTTIPEVMKLSGPSTNFDLLDVGSHDSPTLYREYIPGWADGDVISAEVNWRPSNTVHKNVRIASQAATKKNFKVVYPDSTDNTVDCVSYIQKLDPNADVGKPMTAQIRIKVTGAPVWS